MAAVTHAGKVSQGKQIEEKSKLTEQFEKLKRLYFARNNDPRFFVLPREVCDFVDAHPEFKARIDVITNELFGRLSNLPGSYLDDERGN